VPLFVSTKTLIAFIGQESILLLPKRIGAQYIVLSKPDFEVLVNENQLKVMSVSNLDVGTYML
jgi:hypothetical protein